MPAESNNSTSFQPWGQGPNTNNTGFNPFDFGSRAQRGNGGWGVNSTPGWGGNTQPSPYVQRSTPQFQGLPTIPDMWSQFQGEAGRLQGAADTMHSQLAGANQGFQNLLPQIAPGIMGSAAYASNLLGSLETEMVNKGMGQIDLNGYDKRAETLMTDTKVNLSGAYGQWDSAIGTAMMAVKGYADASTGLVAGMVAGVHQQYSEAMKTAKVGLRGDGSLMTPEEQDSVVASIKAQAAPAVAQTYAQTQDKINSTIASLQMAVAQMKAGKAGAMQQGAEFMSETGQKLLAGRVGAEEFNVQSSLQEFQIRSANRQMMGNFMVAGSAKALEMELNGQAELANLIRSNPQSIVSMLSGMSSIYGLALSTSQLPGMSGQNFLGAGPQFPNGAPEGINPQSGAWNSGHAGNWNPRSG